MNLFKPKSSSSPEPQQGPPPAVQMLGHVFSSFQKNLSNFFQSSQLPFSTAKDSAFARISDAIKPVSPDSPSFTSSLDKNSDRSRNFPAMSADAIEERLEGVPVYALCNASGEFMLVSGSNSRKSVGLFCFNEADAISCLEQLKSVDPSMPNDYQVVPVALNKLANTKVDGVSFRLIPEASQVRNAIKEKKMSGGNDTSFPGVPVFQETVNGSDICFEEKTYASLGSGIRSKSLVLRSKNKKYRPVFFRKEDLEKSLQRASRGQNVMNPSLRAGDIEVAVLEDMIQGMKDNSSSQWNDAVFIPPGFNVGTGPIES